jgi:hypothetical protein
MSDGSLLLVRLAALSTLLPTLVWLILRPGAPSGPGRRLAAWWCLWSGQLAPIALLVGLVASDIGREWAHHGAWKLGIVAGVVGGAIAGIYAVQTVRSLMLAAGLMRARSPTELAERARRIRRNAVLPLLPLAAVTAAAIGLAPGRFGALTFIVLVTIPLGFIGLTSVATSTLARVVTR